MWVKFFHCWGVNMRLVLLCAFVMGFARGLPPLEPEPISICGPEKEVSLQSHGGGASRTVILELNANKSKSLCRLKVTAPKSHVVNLQFMEVMDNQKKNDSDGKEKKPSCEMTIFLPDNTKAPFWKGDPCSGEKMSDLDLLTSEFRILWTPPENHNTIVWKKTIVLTAVGSGPFCKDPFQHTCMRIGRIPMLCISDHLLCDGVQNCPKSSTNSDEDPKLCSTAKNAWENFVVELVKKYGPQTDAEGKFALKTNSTDGPESWFEWQLVKKNVTDKPEVVNETHSTTESISAMLNKYGPWGYLMMGLLICGTVLFFCGLWECCCKRPKPEVDPPPMSTPTTVLIMNCDQGAPPMPPQYDELDLPPSYVTLFPSDEGRYTSLSEEPAPCSSNADNEKNEETDQSSSAQSVQPVTVQETVQIINENDDSSSQDENETNSDSGE